MMRPIIICYYFILHSEEREPTGRNPGIRLIQAAGKSPAQEA